MLKKSYLDNQQYYKNIRCIVEMYIPLVLCDIILRYTEIRFFDFVKTINTFSFTPHIIDDCLYHESFITGRCYKKIYGSDDITSSEQNRNNCNKVLSFKYNVIIASNLRFTCCQTLVQSIYVNGESINQYYPQEYKNHIVYQCKMHKNLLYVSLTNIRYHECNGTTHRPILSMIILEYNSETNKCKYIMTTQLGNLFISNKYVCVYTDRILSIYDKITKSLIRTIKILGKLYHVQDQYIYYSVYLNEKYVLHIKNIYRSKEIYKYVHNPLIYFGEDIVYMHDNDGCHIYKLHS
jgi:hypothetical protein